MTKLATCNFLEFKPVGGKSLPESVEYVCGRADRSPRTKLLTFAVLYYNEDIYLREQISAWLSLPASVSREIYFVVIDDGSKVKGAAAALRQMDTCALAVLTYVIDEDTKWNIGGARNLAMLVAPTEYVFLTDVDIHVPGVLISAMLTTLVPRAERHFTATGNETIFSQFSRTYEPKLRPDKPHPALMLLSRRAYWKVGGCDEDFVGNYGYTDPHFWFRVSQHPNVENIHCHETYPSLPPLVETILEKNSSHRNAAINKRLFLDKSSKNVWSTTYVRFKWRQEDVRSVEYPCTAGFWKSFPEVDPTPTAKFPAI